MFLDKDDWILIGGMIVIAVAVDKFFGCYAMIVPIFLIGHYMGYRMTAEVQKDEERKNK